MINLTQYYVSFRTSTAIAFAWQVSLFLRTGYVSYKMAYISSLDGFYVFFTYWLRKFCVSGYVSYEMAYISCFN